MRVCVAAPNCRALASIAAASSSEKQPVSAIPDCSFNHLPFISHGTQNEVSRPPLNANTTFCFIFYVFFLVFLFLQPVLPPSWQRNLPVAEADPWDRTVGRCRGTFCNCSAAGYRNCGILDILSRTPHRRLIPRK